MVLDAPARHRALGQEALSALHAQGIRLAAIDHIVGGVAEPHPFPAPAHAGGAAVSAVRRSDARFNPVQKNDVRHAATVP